MACFKVISLAIVLSMVDISHQQLFGGNNVVSRGGIDGLRVNDGQGFTNRNNNDNNSNRRRQPNRFETNQFGFNDNTVNQGSTNRRLNRINSQGNNRIVQHEDFNRRNLEQPLIKDLGFGDNQDFTTNINERGENQVDLVLNTGNDRQNVRVTDGAFLQGTRSLHTPNPPSRFQVRPLTGLGPRGVFSFESTTPSFSQNSVQTGSLEKNQFSSSRPFEQGSSPFSFGQQNDRPFSQPLVQQSGQSINSRGSQPFRQSSSRDPFSRTSSGSVNQINSPSRQSSQQSFSQRSNQQPFSQSFQQQSSSRNPFSRTSSGSIHQSINPSRQSSQQSFSQRSNKQPFSQSFQRTPVNQPHFRRPLTSTFSQRTGRNDEIRNNRNNNRGARINNRANRDRNNLNRNIGNLPNVNVISSRTDSNSNLHRTGSQHTVIDNRGPSNFEYQVQDIESGNSFGHRQERNGDETVGSYFVLLPDGRRQEVDYRVDGLSGYVAKVRYV